MRKSLVILSISICALLASVVAYAASYDYSKTVAGVYLEGTSEIQWCNTPACFTWTTAATSRSTDAVTGSNISLNQIESTTYASEYCDGKWYDKGSQGVVVHSHHTARAVWNGYFIDCKTMHTYRAEGFHLFSDSFFGISHAGWSQRE